MQLVCGEEDVELRCENPSIGWEHKMMHVFSLVGVVGKDDDVPTILSAKEKRDYIQIEELRLHDNSPKSDGGVVRLVELYRM